MSGVQIIVLYIPDLTVKIYPELTKTIPVLVQILGAACSLLTVYAIKHMGRKTLIQFGTFGCAFFLFIVGYSFLNRA